MGFDHILMDSRFDPQNILDSGSPHTGKLTQSYAQDLSLKNDTVN